MFKKIINRTSVGLAIALAVGSMSMTDAAHAQSPSRKQTPAQAAYVQTGYGYADPMMVNNGYVQNGQRGQGYHRRHGMMVGCPMMGGGYYR